MISDICCNRGFCLSALQKGYRSAAASSSCCTRGAGMTVQQKGHWHESKAVATAATLRNSIAKQGRSHLVLGIGALLGIHAKGAHRQTNGLWAAWGTV